MLLLPLLLAAGVLLAAAVPAAAQDVIDVAGADAYATLIKDGNAFIKFYAPWCGHCKALAPAWDELAEKIVSASIARVDCTAAANEGVCAGWAVRGYPTLLYVEKGGETAREYSGARTATALAAWVSDPSARDGAKSLTYNAGAADAASSGAETAAAAEEEEANAPTAVVELGEDDFDATLAGDGGARPWLIAFVAPWCGFCKKLKPDARALSLELQKEETTAASGNGGAAVPRVAQVDCTAHKALCKQFGVGSFPTVIARTAGGAFYEYTNGADRSAAALKKFIGAPSGEHGKEVARRIPLIKGQLGETLDMLLEDLNTMYEFKKGILSAVTALAMTIGFVLGRCTTGGGGKAAKVKRN